MCPIRARKQTRYFSRLFLSLLLIGVLPLLVIGPVAYFLTRNLMLERTRQSSNEATGLLAIQTQSLIDEYQLVIDTIERERVFSQVFSASSNQSGRISLEDKTSMYDTLYLLLSGKAIKAGIYVLDGSGSPQLHTNEVPDEYQLEKYINWGVLRKARLAGGATIAYHHKMQPGESLQRVMSMAKCVLSNEGEILGYIIIDLYREHVEELLKRVPGSTYPFLFLLDEFQNPAYVFRGAIDSDGLRDILENPKRTSQYGSSTKTGFSFVFSLEPLERFNFTLLGIYPLHQTEELSSLVAITTIGLGTIMTIICFILALRIARNASSPLSEVVSCLQRITQGDFSARTSIDRTDEFGYLGKSVNSMVEQIETLIATNREKEKNLRTAEIHALQSQIHPHFIFNCLETIKGYILLGQVQDAAETVVELGNLLRSNIDVTEEMISIEEELRIIESYLSLQKRRFGKRLVVTQTIDPALGAFIIPRLILQPIVENAVTHGLEKKKGAGHLAIHGILVDNLVVFTIRDNGVGMPPAIVRKINDRQALESFESHGNGLQNVIDRIRLYYGDVCGVTIESDETRGTTVTITMQPKELL